MDAGVINDKLDSLMRCTARIEDWQPSSLEALQANVDQQDILTLNLTRAVQLCVDIATHITTAAGSSKPATMGESFRQLRELGVLDQYLSEQLQAAVGFRNVAVHSYRRISWEIVYRVSLDSPDQFREFTRQIREHLNAGQE